MTVIHPITEDDKRRLKGKVLKDGESLHFSILMMDAAAKACASPATFLTDAAPGSIDAAVKAAIEEQAKLENAKPVDWLAKQTPQTIKGLIEGVAERYVAGLSAAGVAAGMALDKAIRDQVSYEHGVHVAKFAFMGDRAPAFDRERAEFLARNRLMGGAAFAQDTAAHPAAARANFTRSLAEARYSGTASLTDAEAPRALPKAGGSMQDAGTSGTARPAALDALRAARYSGG